MQAIEDGLKRGFRVVLKHAGPASDIGAKYKVYQHKITGEVWWTGDYRADGPSHGSYQDSELAADRFHHRTDWPFPLAAYLVPRGLKRGQRVFLEDVIEDVPDDARFLDLRRGRHPYGVEPSGNPAARAPFFAFKPTN
jgi:hypothetical protein